MSGFTIGTDCSLLLLDERYRSLFAVQLERLVPVLSGLTDDQWQTPSRNEGWTVQQTMQHVAGVRIENVRVFGGGEPTWSASFDPHTSPQQDIDSRAGESPSETLSGYVESTERFLAHLATRSASEERTTMLWGEPADFRLFFLHLHWDSWVHERDMLVPLGLAHDVDAESARFAVAYAVFLAGVAVRMAGGELETALAVPGVGRTTLSATATAVRLEIEVDGAGHDAYPVTDAGDLVDALSGRGDPGVVIDAPAPIVEALSGLARFLHG